MNAISKLSIAAVVAFASVATAMAQEAGHGAHVSHGAPVTHAGHAEHKATMAGDMVDGEIKKIDTETGKITIRHGELKSLGMQPMTMSFRAKDPAMLTQVKVGDKVKFMAEKVNGAIMVVHLESAN